MKVEDYAIPEALPPAGIASGAAGAADAPAVSMPTGIAILGSHPKTKALAPFDEDWLIYACSPCNSPYGYSQHASPLPRVDTWFEIHVPVFDKTRPYRYLAWLKNIPKVYMRDQWAMQLKNEQGEPLFPTAVLYPDQAIRDTFGPFTFTSSIAFMLAQAIVDIEAGAAHKRIGLWGIMQASQNEYTQQRPGIQNLIWEATRRDIEIYAPDVSRLFDPVPEDF